MTPQAPTVLRCLLATDTDGAPDADLLTRFAQTRDEAAFELLVWRHAGMVLRACRSVLRDHHAAEDACQAAFLALARRPHAVGRRGTVAGWLYIVARRIAARAARRKDQTTTSDRGLDYLPAPPAEPGPDPEAVRLLHDELDRLPDKYRAPVLLCFLDGLTHADAARRLGVPVGTVAGRVARAKEWLCRRLTGRGIAVPAAGLGVFVVNTTAGAVPPAFVAATARAAVALAAGGSPDVSNGVLELAKGEVRAMSVTKLKWAMGVLAACGALTFGAVWAAGPGSDPAASPPAGPPVVAATGTPAPGDPDRRGGAKEDDPEKLFLAMQKKIAAAKTLRVRFDLTATDGLGQTGTAKGTLTLGAGDRYRVELDGKLFGQVVKGTEVSDGATVGLVGSGPDPDAKSPKGTGAYLRRSLPVEGFFLSVVENRDRRADRPAAALTPADFKSGGKEKVGGREAHVVRFTLPAAPDGTGTKRVPMAVWLDAETGLPLKFAMAAGAPDPRDVTNPVGVTEVTETYSEFALDPPVDAKTFEVPKGTAPDAPPLDAAMKKELANLEGTWIVTKREVSGKSLLEAGKPEPPLVIKNGKMTSDPKQAPGGGVDLAKFLDPAKTPKQITVPNLHGGDPKAGVTLIGIYEVTGDELQLCIQVVETARLKEREKERPTAFDSNKGLLTVYKRENDKADDAKKLQGTWTVDPATFKGVEETPAIKEARAELAAMRFVFAGDTLTIRSRPGPPPFEKGREETSTFRLDPTKKPKEIDLSDNARGIYELDGDTLKVCWDHKGKENGRPTKIGFDTVKETVHDFVLKREKPAPPGGEEKKGAAMIDTKWLVGRWQVKDETKEGFEFTKDGKVMVAATLGGEPLKCAGTYRVDGEKVILTVPFGGKDQVITFTVIKLTAAELVLRDENGKVETLVRRREKPADLPGGEKKEADPDKLVGVWEPVDVAGENPPLVVPVEFTKDGKARYAPISYTAEGKAAYSAGVGAVPWGTYTARGDRLEVTSTVEGKEVTHAYGIDKLSGADLVLAFDGGKKKWTFKWMPLKP